MMGHMNILFPDDTMPWPKMQFNTDDQRVLKEKVNRLVTAESYQTLLCRMVKFLDNIQLFNYATEVAKMIKELFRKAG